MKVNKKKSLISFSFSFFILFFLYDVLAGPMAYGACACPLKKYDDFVKLKFNGKQNKIKQNKTK